MLKAEIQSTMKKIKMKKQGGKVRYIFMKLLYTDILLQKYQLIIL